MVPQQEILSLLNQAQQTLPEDKRQPFIEAAASRIGGFLRDHQNALVGAGVGWLVGEIAGRLPIVGTLTGGHSGLAGAVIGGWIGHGKDVKEREAREKIGQIVADELQKASSR